MSVIRRLAVLAFAIVALTAIGASPASAAQFTYSAVGNLEGHATQNQVLTTNAGEVVCSTAALKAELVSLTEEELKAEVNYSGCKAFHIVNVDITTARYNFHSGGSVDIESPITITVTGGILGTCTVSIPAQSVGTVGFETHPSNTNNMLVTPNVSGIEYTGSGGVCRSETAKSGAFKGQSEINRVGGGFVRFDA